MGRDANKSTKKPKQAPRRRLVLNSYQTLPNTTKHHQKPSKLSNSVKNCLKTIKRRRKVSSLVGTIELLNTSPKLVQEDESRLVGLSTIILVLGTTNRVFFGVHHQLLVLFHDGQIIHDGQTRKRRDSLFFNDGPTRKRRDPLCFTISMRVSSVFCFLLFSAGPRALFF